LWKQKLLNKEKILVDHIQQIFAHFFSAHKFQNSTRRMGLKKEYACFVKNLPYNWKKAELCSFIEKKIGEKCIKRARIYLDDKMESKGFGFVELYVIGVVVHLRPVANLICSIIFFIY